MGHRRKRGMGSAKAGNNIEPKLNGTFAIEVITDEMKKISENGLATSCSGFALLLPWSVRTRQARIQTSKLMLFCSGPCRVAFSLSLHTSPHKPRCLRPCHATVLYLMIAHDLSHELCS